MPSRADLTGKHLAVATIGLGLATLVLPTVLIRILVGFPLLFVLPGLALVLYIDPRGLSKARALAMVPGLSLAACLIIGLILGLLGIFTPLPWTIALVGVTAALFALSPPGLIFRTVDGADASRPTISDQDLVYPGKAEVRKIGGSLALWGGVLAISFYLAAGHREFLVTEFWLVPQNDMADSHIVGIKNMEGQPRTYTVDVFISGSLALHVPDVRLQSEETWTKSFKVPDTTSGPGEVRAELYLQTAERTGFSKLYRTVWSTPRRPGDLPPVKPTPIPASAADTRVQVPALNKLQ